MLLLRYAHILPLAIQFVCIILHNNIFILVYYSDNYTMEISFLSISAIFRRLAWCSLFQNIFWPSTSSLLFGHVMYVLVLMRYCRVFGLFILGISSRKSKMSSSRLVSSSRCWARCSSNWHHWLRKNDCEITSKMHLLRSILEIMFSSMLIPTWKSRSWRQAFTLDLDSRFGSKLLRTHSRSWSLYDIKMS